MLSTLSPMLWLWFELQWYRKWNDRFLMHFKMHRCCGHFSTKNPHRIVMWKLFYPKRRASVKLTCHTRNNWLDERSIVQTLIVRSPYLGVSPPLWRRIAQWYIRAEWARANITSVKVPRVAHAQSALLLY